MKEMASLEKQLTFHDRQIELVQKELAGVPTLVKKGLTVAPREIWPPAHAGRRSEQQAVGRNLPAPRPTGNQPDGNLDPAAAEHVHQRGDRCPARDAGAAGRESPQGGHRDAAAPRVRDVGAAAACRSHQGAAGASPFTPSSGRTGPGRSRSRPRRRPKSSGRYGQGRDSASGRRGFP